MLKRLGYLADTMQGDFLFGSAVSVADFYLFVMLSWAQKFDLDVPASLASYRERLTALPSVQLAMKHEGLA